MEGRDFAISQTVFFNANTAFFYGFWNTFSINVLIPRSKAFHITEASKKAKNTFLRIPLTNAKFSND